MCIITKELEAENERLQQELALIQHALELVRSNYSLFCSSTSDMPISHKEYS